MIYSFKNDKRTYCAEASCQEEAVIKIFNNMMGHPEDRRAFTSGPWELTEHRRLASTAEEQELCNGYGNR